MNATTEIEAQVRQIVAELFALQPAEINDDTSRDSVAAWDSVQQLNLVLALEQAFDVAFAPDEIEQMMSFPAICRVLRAKRK
jgi:acyl carrier protein